MPQWRARLAEQECVLNILTTSNDQLKLRMTSTRKWRAAALIITVLACALQTYRGQSQVLGQPGTSARTVVLLDRHWRIDKMPGFNRWKPTAVLSASQMAQLRCPWPMGSWIPVQLPDDYIVGGKFVRGPGKYSTSGNAHALHGYLPVYPAWYHRTFRVPDSARGKTTWLNFGGVYRDSVVFINGKLIGQHPSGYTGFRYNIGKFLRYRRPNTLTVFVDPRFFEGWWYEGGGIYRHVRLIITDKLHVAPWGTFVISKVSREIHYGSLTGDHAYAQLTIQTTVDNAHQTGRQFTLVSRVIDPAGKVVATIYSSEGLAAGGKKTFIQHTTISNAALWSLHHCNLYHLETTLKVDAATVDQKRTTFGIRTIRFGPNRGFFLDGRHVELDGTCNHQDFPAVGIGAPDNLWFWRIEKLKAMGSNAYRTAHNPLASAFYRACDHLGMLVMDENRHLGDVYTAKTPMGSQYSNFSDIDWMVLSQRNDPCIIFWSMCNEETLQGNPYGAKIFKAMMRAVHKLDPTRPCTCAMSGGFNKVGFFSVENLLGINYRNQDYAAVHRLIPDKMVYGSEDTNIYSDRGVLRTSRKRGMVNEYGSGPRFWRKDGKFWYLWNHAPWHTLIPVMTHPFVAGEFVWTGFNYRGEPNPFGWPAVSSCTGMMDLCGFPKPVYYYWRAWWEKKPSVYIFPAWTFPRPMIGKPVLVRCYSNCHRVGLFLNGKSLGVKRMPKYKYLDWTVPYTPGKLTASGYDGDGHKVVARWSYRTAGAAAALQLRDEVPTLSANGESLAPIAIQVVDARGIPDPDARNMIRFRVSGPGTIAGVANGSSASHESNIGHQVRAFHGLCMVMVRATRDPGTIILTARAKGLPSATLAIRTSAPPAP